MAAAAQEAYRDISDSLHEACADRADHGRGRCASRTGRCTSTRTTKIPRRCAAKLRRCSALTVDHVVVHTYPGPGHYGRSNGGNAGAEDEAVILSQGRRQARARAVDARRGFAMVHAVARCDLRRADRGWTQRQNGRLSGRPLHARDAGRPADRRGARRAADDAGTASHRSIFSRLHRQRHFRSLDL